MTAHVVFLRAVSEDKKFLDGTLLRRLKCLSIVFFQLHQENAVQFLLNIIFVYGFSRSLEVLKTLFLVHTKASCQAIVVSVLQLNM